jgi:hypothetical protein
VLHAHGTPQKNNFFWANRVALTRRHQSFDFLSDARAEIFDHLHCASLPPPVRPLIIYSGGRRRGKERENGRGRKKIHAEDGSFAMPAPGVRERLRISFNSAQRLTRAASESPPPPPPSVVGGWDTTLRAVGLGGGDGSSRQFASL